MRVYFLSYTPAALKLNGIYAGTIDGFERHVELDPNDGILAEIVPGDNLQPVNFFLNAKFFKEPPDFADVYLTDGDALIYMREYSPKDLSINVIYQTRFSGNLVTVFSQGGVYLSIEGAQYVLDRLPLQFCNIRAEEKTIAGRPVLALYAGDYLLIISEYGKKIFLNCTESAEFGNVLKITTEFETCTAAKAECEFSYDGERLTQINGRTIETRQPEGEILHFAFFESVLTCGNFADYLSDELKAKAGNLKSYLGDFVGVTIPPEKFFLKHGDIRCAGLVYPKSKNLYEVKYFSVETENGKISNISPIE